MPDASPAPAAVGLVDFTQIPGIDLVQSAGLRIMGIVFVAQLTYELYKMLRGESPDLAGPIAKTTVGILLVNNIPTIGSWLSSLTLTLSSNIGNEAELALFGRAITVALENTTCDETGWTAALGLIFSVKGWIMIFSSVIFVFMFLAKFIIIDVLYPVCFSLVLFLGLLSIPISLFPGSNGLRGWVKNVVEVSMWPVVAQFLIAMLAVTFPQALASMADGEVTLNCGSGATIGPDEAVKPGATGFVALLQYLAICCTYVILILFSPALSAMIMRGGGVGLVGGVMAAKAGGLVGGSLTKAAQATGARAGKVGAAVSEAFGLAAARVRRSGRSSEEQLNQRD